MRVAGCEMRSPSVVYHSCDLKWKEEGDRRKITIETHDGRTEHAGSFVVNHSRNLVSKGGGDRLEITIENHDGRGKPDGSLVVDHNRDLKSKGETRLSLMSWQPTPNPSQEGKVLDLLL